MSPLRSITGVWLVAVVLTNPAISQESGTRRTVEPKQPVVLVELFTSQGCNYCPTADRLLQRLESRGYGTDRVVPIAFHVDYFNDAWTDPFSNRQYSGRQWAYHQAAQDRDPDTPNLYFTPMVMVAGRFPMSGYHKDGVDRVWPLLKARLDRAFQRRPMANLSMTITAPPKAPNRRDLTVRVWLTSRALDGQERLVAVAITEGRLHTEVPSGENSGKTLVEDNVVRRFEVKSVTLERGQPSEVEFSLNREDGWNPEQCSVVVFLQDEETGYVHQAAETPWVIEPR